MHTFETDDILFLVPQNNTPAKIGSIISPNREMRLKRSIVKMGEEDYTYAVDFHENLLQLNDLCVLVGRIDRHGYVFVISAWCAGWRHDSWFFSAEVNEA